MKAALVILIATSLVGASSGLDQITCRKELDALEDLGDQNSFAELEVYDDSDISERDVGSYRINCRVGNSHVSTEIIVYEEIFDYLHVYGFHRTIVKLKSPVSCNLDEVPRANRPNADRGVSERINVTYDCGTFKVTFQGVQKPSATSGQLLRSSNGVRSASQYISGNDTIPVGARQKPSPILEKSTEMLASRSVMKCSSGNGAISAEERKSSKLGEACRSGGEIRRYMYNNKTLDCRFCCPYNVWDPARGTCTYCATRPQATVFTTCPTESAETTTSTVTVTLAKTLPPSTTLPSTFGVTTAAPAVACNITPPAAPQNLKLDKISSHYVNLSFDEVESNKCAPVGWYEVKIQNTSGTELQNKITNETKLHIGHLKPRTGYTICVRAKNDIGSSPWSRCRKFRTLNDMLKNVRITCGSNYLTAFWDEDGEIDPDLVVEFRYKKDGGTEMVKSSTVEDSPSCSFGVLVKYKERYSARVCTRVNGGKWHCEAKTTCRKAVGTSIDRDVIINTGVTIAVLLLMAAIVYLAAQLCLRRPSA